MSKDLECPYCEKWQEPSPDNRDVDVPYEHECEFCEKNFQYTIEYTASYDSSKADCLNGSPHDYQEIRGFPKEYFANKRRCSMCDDEITIKET